MFDKKLHPIIKGVSIPETARLSPAALISVITPCIGCLLPIRLPIAVIILRRLSWGV
jgi:hypothetical protein